MLVCTQKIYFHYYKRYNQRWKRLSKPQNGKISIGSGCFEMAYKNGKATNIYPHLPIECQQRQHRHTAIKLSIKPPMQSASLFSNFSETIITEVIAFYPPFSSFQTKLPELFLPIEFERTKEGAIQAIIFNCF